jgi:hypothetical protein
MDKPAMTPNPKDFVRTLFREGSDIKTIKGIAYNNFGWHMSTEQIEAIIREVT